MGDAISGAATRSCGNTSVAIWRLRHCEAQGLLKELKDARQTVELMDACGKRVCSSEEHWGCPYGNEGMTDCAVLLEAAYEDTIEKLLALKETLEG